MGSFNNFRAFLSTHILPQHHLDNSLPSLSKTRSSMDNHTPRDSVQATDLFPCEDRHSFNPHYQHNLHSTSPSYSTPPSLSSSPTNSSPSSTTSSGSNSSLALSASVAAAVAAHGSKAVFGGQYYPSRRSLSQSSRQQLPHQYQYQYHTQHQQQQHSPYHTHPSHGRPYSYSRQQQRRQQQRQYAYQQHEEDMYMGDDMMVSYDSIPQHQQQHHHGQPSPVSLRASFSNGHGTSSASTPTRQQRQKQAPVRTSHGQTSRAETESRSAGVVLNHIRRTDRQSRSPSSMMPRISESSSALMPWAASSTSLSSLQSWNDDSALSAMSMDTAMPETETRPLSKTKAAPTPAQQSLMRIAKCDPHQDNWCPHQAGQWIRHYAETCSRGLVVDGRHARRM